MNNTKRLLYPEWRVTIGTYVFRRGIQIECFSSKDAHADWCTVGLIPELLPRVEVAEGDKAVIELGYEGDYDCILSGKVCPPANASALELTIKDDMTRLDSVTIRGTFMDCTPQDIIRYIMETAGIVRYELSNTVYAKQEKIAISARRGTEAIKAVDALWGTNNSFFFRNGVFYWGIRPLQNYIYILDRGNLLSLTKLGSLWEAATLGVPWIHHSDVIRIEHIKLSGLYEVEKVIIKNDDIGCIRQYVYFKGES